jgi:hypothetical protein
LGEVFLEQQTLEAEAAELDRQIAQLDCLVERNMGLVATGNDTQLAVLVLEAQEESFTRAAVAAELDFVRRRLTLMRQLVGELQTALKKAERAGKRNSASKPGAP